MKKFVKIATQFKFAWGLAFTSSMILYSVVNMLLGNKSMEFIVVWQFAAISVIIVFLHYLIFSEYIFSSLLMRYRIMIHFPLGYITIFISSIILKWISISDIKSIEIFTAAYISYYLSAVLGFYIYYKVTGEELNKKLSEYKEKKMKPWGEKNEHH